MSKFDRALKQALTNKHPEPIHIFTVSVASTGQIVVKANDDMIPQTTSELCMLLAGVNAALAEACKGKIVKP